MPLPLLKDTLPANWSIEPMPSLLATPEFINFNKTLLALEAQNKLSPGYNDIFKALTLTSPNDVKVVILGQDPYPRENDAMGLSFSVNPTQPIPRSLKNIYKELIDDVGIDNTAKTGDLSHWAKQGVLLLNTTLTTETTKTNAHRNKGWEEFTTAIIQYLNNNATSEKPIVFILWGNAAKEKGFLLSNPNVYKIESPHPSPFSARTGFFGSKPFSQTNMFLESHSMDPIDWSV